MVEATLRSVARNGLNKTTLASVSHEAGLSQGVAVFYFESKDKLLAAAFRHQYEIYRRTWGDALAAAGDDAAAQAGALIRADFDPMVFNPEALAVWHAYWGDSTARPIYADISQEFDSERSTVLASRFAALADGDAEAGARMAAAVEALTDGLWLRAHLSPTWAGPKESLALTAWSVGQFGVRAAGRVADHVVNG